MDSQNNYFDLASYVNRYMADSIKKHHLQIEKGQGDVLMLSNPYCIIYLKNYGEGVGFAFAARKLPDEKYQLSTYLDAIMEGGYYHYCPKSPSDQGREEAFVGILRKYDGAILAGALEFPLSGDFTWVEKFKGYVAECARLEKELARLEAIDEHPDCDDIWRKERNGDLTWMDDVRRILAEKESPS